MELTFENVYNKVLAMDVTGEESPSMRLVAGKETKEFANEFLSDSLESYLKDYSEKSFVIEFPAYDFAESRHIPTRKSSKEWIAKSLLKKMSLVEILMDFEDKDFPFEDFLYSATFTCKKYAHKIKRLESFTEFRDEEDKRENDEDIKALKLAIKDASYLLYLALKTVKNYLDGVLEYETYESFDMETGTFEIKEGTSLKMETAPKSLEEFYLALKNPYIRVEKGNLIL